MSTSHVEDKADVYVTQLREVFDSCDADKDGKLNRAQLWDLCERLQLDEEIETLVNQLLASSKDGTVNFDQFKEGFVEVLAKELENSKAEEDEDEEEDGSRKTANNRNNRDAVQTPETVEAFDLSGELEDEPEALRAERSESRLSRASYTSFDTDDDEVSPKYVKGEKKYGRKSRPETPEEFSFLASLTRDDAHKYRQRTSTPANNQWPEKLSLGSQFETEIDLRDTDKSPVPKNATASERGKHDETFEAEGTSSNDNKVRGQLNLSIADMENALDPVSEEQHLKDIWRELGVGKNGALTLHELANVCEHIGMDEMNTEELQHLFDKLDVDEDGQVSFNEFLQGLFQHGGPTPTPTSATPVRHLSTPRQKLRLSYLPEERNHTPPFPSIGSGLFSSLNSDGSGYAKPEAIIELWESMGVLDGPAILEYLQFDTSIKVSLGDLSNALEQEIRTVEEDNATYRAATATFQHELHFLKTTNEHTTAERDKLQTDLTEAINRISILIKEGDDRVSALEHKKDKDIKTLEERYQDQVKALQSQLESEQTNSLNKSARQGMKMEMEIARLKDEETKLKENLNRTQKELEKLEHEILEMAEKCIDLEKQNERQQRELSSAKDLQRKLEEMESNRDAFQNEQQKFTQQRLEQIEIENKNLKDKNDELTMEVEALKQQLSTTRKRGRTNLSSDQIPNRTGSILSDYAKPNIIRRGGDDDESDDDASRSQQGEEDADANLNHLSVDSERLEVELAEVQKAKTVIEQDYRTKVSALQKEKDDLQAEKDDLHSRFEVEIEELMNEKEESEKQLKAEILELKDGFENERKDIEQAFKLEITELEENHKFEQEEILSENQREKDELQRSLTEQHEEEMNAQVAQQRTELERIFESQKREILIKLESEKNLITQKFAEEKSDVIKR